MRRRRCIVTRGHFCLVDLRGWIRSVNLRSGGGDPQADWVGLAGSIRGGLSWGLTGAQLLKKMEDNIAAT